MGAQPTESQEAVSFVILVLQDLPVVVIDYVAFKEGPCRLYRQLFEDSITGNLALFASFLSALWELIMSFRLCCMCDYNVCLPCRMERALTDIGCCFCRFLRPTFAIFLLGFSTYVSLIFVSDDDFRCGQDNDTVMEAGAGLTTAVTF